MNMFQKEVRRQNAVITSAAVDLGVAIVKHLQGGALGNVNEEEVAEIISSEINNEVVNRRENNANN
jgi:hypothetical protein